MPESLALVLTQDPAAPEGGESAPATPGFSIPPFLLIGLVFYFVLIGPERKNRKKREAMLSTLEKGDKVITTSGLHGQIVQVQDDVVTLQVGGPILLIALVVGLIISLFQALTQIQEMTLSFVPKILIICLSVLLFMPFMLSTMTAFTERMADRIVGLG